MLCWLALKARRKEALPTGCLSRHGYGIDRKAALPTDPFHIQGHMFESSNGAYRKETLPTDHRGVDRKEALPTDHPRHPTHVLV